MKNQRGQALVESLMLAVILVFSIFFLIRSSIKMQNAIAVDEFVEQNLLCQLSKKTFCEQNLRRQMAERGYQDVRIQSDRFQNKFSIKMQALSPFNDRIEKESELTYELSIH